MDQPSVPDLESANMDADWERFLASEKGIFTSRYRTNSFLERPATPPEPNTQDSRLVIDEPSSPVSRTEVEPFGSPRSVESIHNPMLLNDEILGDPHRIRDDINDLDDSTDRKQVLILTKLNDRGSNNTLKIDNLMGHVGRPVTSREYFLNGQPEPSKYDDDQSISENIIALRNVTRHNRVSLDNLTHKIAKELKKIKESCSNSLNPNAEPNAEFQAMKQDLATALTKVTSLSRGGAFNTMDLQARIVVLENEKKTLARKVDILSKSVGLLKNGQGQSSSSANQLPLGINRFDERLLKLEEHAFGQSSRNLFETTMETTIDVLSKEVRDLRKDLKLNLAGSEMNNWLDAKLKAFLDTPAFIDRINCEFKNLMINWQITPRNMPQDTRAKIVEVSDYEIS